MDELKACPFCGSSNTTLDQTEIPPDIDTIARNLQIMSTLAENQQLKARIAELSQAVGLITTLKPTMVMDANHPLDMAKEVTEYVAARIAELEHDLTNKEIEYTDLWDDALAFQSRIAELESEIVSLSNKANAKLQDLKAELAELRERTRWIPVSERLPEEKQSVLALDRTGTAYHWEYSKCLSNIFVGYYTHWMPMPEPPEVK